MEYKGMQYLTYPDYAAIKVEQHGDFDLAQILSCTTFAELTGHAQPNNLIIDRRKAKKLPDHFIDFLEEKIFVQLLEYGVKRIFFIIPQNELQSAIDQHPNIPSYVSLCSTLDSVFNILQAETGGSAEKELPRK